MEISFLFIGQFGVLLNLPSVIIGVNWYIHINVLHKGFLGLSQNAGEQALSRSCGFLCDPILCSRRFRTGFKIIGLMLILSQLIVLLIHYCSQGLSFYVKLFI
jgi:hypothetical protein